MVQKSGKLTSWYGKYAYYLQGFSTIPGGREWDFWTINSLTIVVRIHSWNTLATLTPAEVMFVFEGRKKAENEASMIEIHSIDPYRLHQILYSIGSNTEKIY